MAVKEQAWCFESGGILVYPTLRTQEEECWRAILVLDDAVRDGPDAYEAAKRHYSTMGRVVKVLIERVGPAGADNA